MFHLYDGYHFIGMHLIWWAFWILFISILFGLYEPVRRTDGRKGNDESQTNGEAKPRS